MFIKIQYVTIENEEKKMSVFTNNKIVCTENTAVSPDEL